jgi:predicted nucleic acid-binding protein
MKTAIDANIFSAIWSWEPKAAQIVAQLGEAKEAGALIISPFVYAELLAYPNASETFVRNFLEKTGIAVEMKLEPRLWTEAGLRYGRYVVRRRKSTGVGPRRLLVDYLIGAHALIQADRLLTLDAKGYRQDFPELILL